MAKDNSHETPVTRLSTGTGGKLDKPVDDQVLSGPKINPDLANDASQSVVPVTADLAKSMLASGREMAKPGRAGKGRGNARRDRSSDGRRGGYSGAAPDELDPQLVGASFLQHVERSGWDRSLAEARLFSDWDRIVGTDIASRCRPVTLREGQLSIAAESTAWATQLRGLAAALLARITAEVGTELVTTLRITGPVGPTWKHGQWSVRGRGPRDTYG